MKRPSIAQRFVDRAAKGNTACVFPHIAGAGLKLAKSISVCLPGTEIRIGDDLLQKLDMVGFFRDVTKLLDE